MGTEDRADNVEGYAILREILEEAYDQSARGKGHDRHANGRYFEQQPIMEIGRMVGPGFATGQVMKKAQEATSMAARGEAEAAVRELLGVIVYAASAVALVREKAPRADVDRRRFDAAGCDGRARSRIIVAPPADYEAYAQACAIVGTDGVVHASLELIEWMTKPGSAEFMADDIERRRREAASADRPFKVEEGKSYLMRDGSQTGPMQHRGGDVTYPWTDNRGAMLTGFVRSWRDDGVFHCMKPDHPKDLIAELVN